MTTRIKPDCHGCEAESFSRNNYFTGKLMVERDFTDEQRYFMEKIRLHHQRLHGSGVVCGLQIEAHGEPCDDRYVILQPGTAVDCCGKDILVTAPEVIDLYAFPAMQELLATIEEAEDNPDAPAENSHRLQLCIRYRECPGEDIPVLYDECGCDDTQCAPNRILESWAVDLMIDPEIPPLALHQPRLNWNSTVNVAHAGQVFLHEATNRLYIMTEDDAGILYQVSTSNFTIEASFALGRRGLALCASASGDELYVVVANAGGIGAGDGELWVFDVTGTNLAAGTDRESVIAGSGNSEASALGLADGRLLVLFHSGGRLRLWDAGLASPMDPAATLDLGADLHGLSAGSDPRLVYSAGSGTANVHRFDVDAAGFAPALINGAVDTSVDQISRVAVVVSTAPDQLLVLDDGNNQLRLVEMGGTGTGTVALMHQPIDVAISPGAHWAYVLVADGDDSFIQTVNLHSLRQGNGVTAGVPVPVGDASRGVTVTSGAERLFIPYVDDLAVDNAGGVAVVDINEANCRDLLWPEDCPACDTSDCLVLATIENYRPGFRVLDMPVPAPDPLADLADGVARIDNRQGRKRLPSTQAIAAALECMLENCCGGTGGGEQGPPGLPGAPGVDGAPGENGAPGVDGEDGRSISQVEVTMVPCGQPPSGQVIAVGDELLLSLEIPGNCNTELAHLCNINWFHDGQYQDNQLSQFVVMENDQNHLRFLIRFDAPVRADDLNRHSIRLSVNEYLSAIYQRLELHCLISPGVFRGPACELTEFSREERIDVDFVNGAEILVPVQWIGQLRTGFILRFSIHGDFIRDRKDRGADLNHLPLWLTSQDPAQATADHTGDGVGGGEFISWFSYTRESSIRPGIMNRVPAMAALDDTFYTSYDAEAAANNERALRLLVGDRIAINRASREELTALRGVGPELAEAIINARSTTAIRTENDLMKIPGIGKSLMARLRNHISFDDGD